MAVQKTGCVACAAPIADSEIYLRPGDGSPLCGRCYLSADRSSLEPPPDPRGASTQSSGGAGELVAEVAIGLLAAIISE